MKDTHCTGTPTNHMFRSSEDCEAIYAERELLSNLLRNRCFMKGDLLVQINLHSSSYLVPVGQMPKETRIVLQFLNEETRAQIPILYLL